MARVDKIRQSVDFLLSDCPPVPTPGYFGLSDDCRDWQIGRLASFAEPNSPAKYFIQAFDGVGFCYLAIDFSDHATIGWTAVELGTCYAWRAQEIFR